MNTIDMGAATPAERATFVGRVLMLIRKSAFARHDRWSQAVVILSPEEKRVTSRADFSMWLRANDLRALADECMKTRVPHDHVIVWLAADNAKGACAGFALVDVMSEVSAVRASLAQA